MQRREEVIFGAERRALLRATSLGPRRSRLFALDWTCILALGKINCGRCRWFWITMAEFVSTPAGAFYDG